MSNIPSIDNQAPPVNPVFFDPTRKRWPRVRLWIAIISAMLCLLMGGLVLSIATSPILPALHLPAASFLPHGAHKLPPLPSLAVQPSPNRARRALHEAKAKLASEQQRAVQALLARTQLAGPATVGHPLAIGFFVNWDDASFSSLKENLGSLDMLIPEWLHLEGEDGALREDDPNRQAQVIDYLRTHRPEMRIMPLVNNWNGKQWEGDKLARMLADPAARARAIERLLAYAEGHRFGGISIDFESIPARAQPVFGRFIEELYARLHATGLELSVNVPASDPAFDYAALARNADYLIVMAY